MANPQKYKIETWNHLIIFTTFLITSFTCKVFAQSVPNIPVSQFQRREVLDPNVGLALEWSVNRESNTINLQVEIESGNGNFALGLTRKGHIEGSDVIYFEVENGIATPSVSDMFGEDNTTIVQDTNQDWRQISSSTSQNLIRIQIQRNLDTCDEQDLKIDESLIKVVWDYGVNSSLPSQFDVKGVEFVYFTDTRVYSNANISDLRQGRISRNITLPPRHTTYWCSINKLEPSLMTKHHIVGFSAYFRDEESERRVHHQLLYRCTAPPGMDAASLFEPFLNHPGEECYIKDVTLLPATLCREFVAIWSVGAPPFILPDTTGIPIGGSESNYFMFETHYDNPDMIELVVENGMDFEYTSQLRQDEGSLIFVGSGLVGIFAIPPQSPSFDIVGHCSGRCTSEMIPLTGAEVQAVALHTHVTGRRMRLKQIRGNTELPWIENDDNYEFAYQPLRLLNDPPTIRPGDQLTMQCNYDNTGTNGSTSSGYATRDEMCTAFILLNKKVPYLLCSSEYPSEKLFNRFGIRNMTWELERHERIVTSAVDPSNEGLSMGEVVGNWSTWTTQERTEWEREMMYSNHNGNCPNVRVVGQLAYAIIRLQEATGGLVTVPVIEEANPTRQSMRTPIPAGPVSYPIGITTYVPPNVCRNVDPFSNTNNLLSGLGGGATLLPNIPQLFRERLNGLLPNSSQNAFGGFINRFTG